MAMNFYANPVPKHIMEEIANAYNLEFPENFRKLVTFFSHSDWLMRKTASEYTAKLGNQIVNLLFEKLNNNAIDDDTLYWGIKTFAKIATDSAAEKLLELIRNSEFNNNQLIFIIRALGDIKTPRAIAPLIELLGNPNWLIRKEAAAALTSTGRASVPALKEAFSSGNKDIRYWTVKILSQLLGNEACESFKKLLKSDKKDLRYYAVTALGELKSDDSLETIIKALGDESWLVRAQAAEILEQKGKSIIKHLKAAYPNGNSDVKYWSIKVIAKIQKDEALEYLKKILETDDTEIKFWVIDALSQMSFKNAAPIFVKLFEDPSWLVRKYAAATIEKFGHKATNYLADLLNENANENIRYWAVQIISKADDNNFQKLLDVLEDPNGKEKVFIVQTLRETKNKTALKYLFKLLSDEKWIIRRESAQTLIEFGADIVVPYIITNVNYNESPDMSYWVQKICLTFEEAAVEILIEMSHTIQNYNDDNDEDSLKFKKIYNLLAIIGSQKAVDFIINSLKNKKMMHKEVLISSIGNINNENFIKNLIKKLDNEDPGICFWIAQILKSMPKHLRNILYTSLDDKNPEKRIWICKIFSEIKDSSFIHPLLILLSDKDKSVRYEATKALSKFGSEEVTESLIKQFIEEDEEGKICIIENIKNLINDKMIEKLIKVIDDSSDTDNYWIAKILTEGSNKKAEFFEKYYNNSVDGSMQKYWLKKIIDHIKGLSYL